MSNKSFDPINKVIVVTGGASGIGAAICLAFAKARASAIVVADMNVSKAEQICKKCSSCCPQLSPLPRFISRQVDVSNDSDVKNLVAFTESNVGLIDLFVCNAGIMPPKTNPELTGATWKEGQFASNDEWKYIHDVNMMQLVSVARYIIPQYLKRKGGHIVITASAAGFCPIGSPSYSVSKAAAVNFGEWLSVTYGSRGIGVTLLCPQRTRSAMTNGFTGSKGAWLGRLIEADDVANCCINALKSGTIYAFPHAEVATYIKRKVTDPDRWVKGMRRLNESVTYTDEEETGLIQLSKL